MHQDLNGLEGQHIGTPSCPSFTGSPLLNQSLTNHSLISNGMIERLDEWSFGVEPETATTAKPSVEYQLAAELQSERCLNRLGQRLNACILDSLTAASEHSTLLCDGYVSLARAVVDELSTELAQSCAMVLRCGEAMGDRVQCPANSAEPSFIVRAIAAGPSQPTAEGAPFSSTTALMPFVLGQLLSERELQNWHTQFPARSWQIDNDHSVIGWFLLAPAAVDFQREALGDLESFTACLNAHLIEQSLDRYCTAVRQVELIQAQAQQRQALATCNDELTQANQLKSEFLANTSHEIRTPLSSILGFTHLMREQGFSPSNLKHQEYLNIILSSGQHLLSLINDILDLSKIEANQLDLHVETVDVKAVCQTAIALVREKANDRGLSLHLEIAPHVETLVADPLRLKQMLFNLLSNALKFTRKGSVGLQVTASDEIRFTVWDTGTGISEDQQQLLFRPYSQIANAAAKRDEGTGLGLTLTQKLAELHGGWVEFRSQPGQGSRFTIVLPWGSVAAGDRGVTLPDPSDAPVLGGEQPEEPDYLAVKQVSLQPVSPAKPDPATRSNHLLLVEDNPYNAKLMLTYLSKLGYELTWVKDGTEMRQALARALPALILMDIHLPDEDGLTLMQALKLDERYCAIPVIAQTAMAMTGDRAVCLNAGAAAYISKPIDLKVLAQMVGQYVKGLKQS
ncbi:MAG: ATP-binding protein [Leptolyngbya sp. BL-A-14]